MTIHYCYHSDESFRKRSGFYVLAQIEENQPGYFEADSFPDLASAQARAAQFNQWLNLTADDVFRIRTSSMIASRNLNLIHNTLDQEDNL